MPRKSAPLALFLLVFCLVLAVPARAFAYGDPSGGYLFQMLTPLAAVLWGAWLIFAGGIRKRVAKVFGRTQISAPEQPSNEAVEHTPETN